MQESALLQVSDGAETGRRIEAPGRVTLGRGEEAGVLIEDPEVSRVHAVLCPTPEGLELHDLGSLNGTWVNGERISGPTVLAPGDVIKLGATQLEVVSTGRWHAPVARA